MKKFLIKVNGNQYEVEVEEVRDGSTIAATTEVRPAPAVTAAPAVVTAAPVAAPAAPQAPAKKEEPVLAGSSTINSPMPGTILKVNVNAGDSVKKNQVLVILEAMKMENEIVAPTDGKIASVNVSKGTSVNAGDVLVSMV